MRPACGRGAGPKLRIRVITGRREHNEGSSPHRADVHALCDRGAVLDHLDLSPKRRVWRTIAAGGEEGEGQNYGGRARNHACTVSRRAPPGIGQRASDLRQE